MKTVKTPGKAYLVGGAVRDKILGLPHKEADYVVVGATPAAMTKAGFMPVGKNFPVFLHPVTHEEYALARTERKIAQGHQGFNFYTNTKITLEEDLKRRDLTINAIAEATDDSLIDPYHGKADLDKRILRHVSEAFSEDPLRIFRVARFRSYLGRFDFQIAPETLALMREMVTAGAITELSDERIWRELEKALQSTHPELFFITLREVGALAYILPKLTEQGLAALQRARTADDNPEVSFAALAYEGPYLKKLPTDYEDLQILVQTHYQDFGAFLQLNVEKKLGLLHALDFLRRPERSENFLAGCFAITQNEKSFQAIRTSIKLLKTLNRAELAEEAQQRGQDIRTYINEAEKKLLTS